MASPISAFLGKERQDFTREDLLKIIIEKKLERITFHYTGIDGKVKELRIPIINRKQVELILAEGERVDGSSLFKGIVDTGKSDLYIVPVYRTAFLNPFDSGSIDFICRFIDRDGNLVDYAPDNILHKATQALKKNTGMELWALGEIEFYLIGEPSNRTYPMNRQEGYHATAPFIKTGPILDEMVKYITQIFGNVKYAHGEVGHLEYVESQFEELHGKSAEQVEIEFLPAPVEDAADILVLASWIIRNTAYRHNYIATFFPKIEIGHAGNGLHIHMMLKKDGKNVLVDTKNELSDDAMMLIGGLCQYAPSLTSFGNMVSASYLRLVPNQEAPTKVCWSSSNRSAMIRVPLGWNNLEDLSKTINPQQKTTYKCEEPRQTVELRTPDGSANAHLLLAGLTMAAEWGLTHKKESMNLAKSCHVSVNIHSTASMEHLSELATSCYESAEKLLQVRSLYERNNVFPHSMISYVANMLQRENDRNLNNRLMSLEEDEKVFQSRRIMHRDIHRH
jgi:glutamine synthetase